MSKQNALHKLIFRSNLYNGTLQEKKTKSISKIQIKTFPGNIEIGNQIFQGKFLLSGYNIDLRNKLPWKMNTSNDWKKDFHSFFWLHHLRATNTISASKFSQTIIKKWIKEYNHWDEFTWKISLVSRRIESWILNYNFLIREAEQEFIDILYNSICRQSKHLLRWHSLNNNSTDQIQTGLSIFLYGTLSNKKKLSQKALKLINYQIARNKINKNLFDCSNASEVLVILRILSTLKIINNQTFKLYIDQLDILIEYLLKVIITLTHNDENLSVFNGSFENNEDLIIILNNLNIKKSNIKPIISIPDLGFERINVKRLSIIIKSGKFNSSKNYLGPLSFEASVGKERLVVNCGTFSGEDKAWDKLSKSNQAYSTLTVNNSNPDFIEEKKIFEPTLRGDEDTNSWLEVRHHGYRKKFGIIHVRRIHIFHDGMEIGGNDSIIATDNFDINKKYNAILRFHLHPSISASTTGNSEEVLLRLSKGSGWLFKVNSQKAKVEESIYMGMKGEMKRSQQIVVEFNIDSPKQEIFWKFLMLNGREL